MTPCLFPGTFKKWKCTYSEDFFPNLHPESLCSTHPLQQDLEPTTSASPLQSAAVCDQKDEVDGNVYAAHMLSVY